MKISIRMVTQAAGTWLAAFTGLGLWTVPAAAASPGGWQAPEEIGRISEFTDGGVATNARGMMVAVWAQSGACGGALGCQRIVSRTRDALGHWKPLESVGTKLGDGDEIDVHLSAAGVATATWFDKVGHIFTSDRVAGKWTTQLLLGTFGNGYTGMYPDYKFVENTNGDAAVMWASGQDYTYDSRLLKVATRRAGGAWTISDVASTTSRYVLFDDVAINAGGDLVASWQLYTAGCHGACAHNLTLYAGRLGAGTTQWHETLIGSEVSGVGSLVALDDQGRAGLVGRGSDILAFTQQSAAAAWSAPVHLAGSLLLFGTDATGHATIITGEPSLSTPVSAIDGDLATDRWQAPVVVADPGTLYTVNLAIAAGGRAVLAGEWDVGPVATPQYRDFATVRPATGAAWGALEELTGTTGFQQPRVAVQAGGTAVVSTTDTHGYATGTTPSETVTIYR